MSYRVGQIVRLKKTHTTWVMFGYGPDPHPKTTEYKAGALFRVVSDNTAIAFVPLQDQTCKAILGNGRDYFEELH